MKRDFAVFLDGGILQGDLPSLMFLENLNSAMSPNEDFGEPERVTEVVVERKRTS